MASQSLCRRYGQFYWQGSALVHDLQSRPGFDRARILAGKEELRGFAAEQSERGGFGCVFSLQCCQRETAAMGSVSGRNREARSRREGDYRSDSEFSRVGLHHTEKRTAQYVRPA